MSMRPSIRLRPPNWRPPAPGPRRFTTAQKIARNQLLRRIYKPFDSLEKDSAEYDRLSRSGTVWHAYFRPDDDTPYREIQKESRSLLAEIDELKVRIAPRLLDYALSLSAAYSQQSVMIEKNPLTQQDAVRVASMLPNVGGQGLNPSTSIKDLAQIHLPHLGSDHGRDSSHLNELKNHIVASDWITCNGRRFPGTLGLDQDELRHLAIRTIRDTDSEDIYNKAWGGRVALGGYRQLPIQVASEHLRVFPYPQEVPACMDRYFRWKASQHEKGEMHPLLHACHLTAHFVHIHPFPDGNGRTSRLQMQDYMVRQGYLPVVIKNLKRSDYIRMITGAMDGEPGYFVEAVLEAELEALRECHAAVGSGSHLTT